MSRRFEADVRWMWFAVLCLVVAWAADRGLERMAWTAFILSVYAFIDAWRGDKS